MLVTLHRRAALALLLAHCAAPAPRPRADVKSRLQAVKTAVVQAYIDLDAKALSQLYTDDFTVTDGKGGIRTKQDELDYVRSNPKTRLVAGRYRLIGVRVYGDLAVGSGHARMTTAGENGPAEVTYRSFNVFRFERGRWRYAAAFTP